MHLVVWGNKFIKVHWCLSVHRKMGDVVLFHVDINTLITEETSRWVNNCNQFKPVYLFVQVVLFCNFFLHTLWDWFFFICLGHDFVSLDVLILCCHIYTSQEELVSAILIVSDCFTILSKNLSSYFLLFCCWYTLIILWLIRMLW